MEIFSDIRDLAIKVEQLLNSVLMVAVDILEFKGEQAMRLEQKVQLLSYRDMLHIPWVSTSLISTHKYSRICTEKFKVWITYTV